MTTQPETSSPPTSFPALGDEALEMCQALLRMDTTNPPGNERPAADYLQRKLAVGAHETPIRESAAGRANLVCRFRGSGASGPLLLTGHLDVVEAFPDQWSHPPFAGEIAEGCLWGRGAIDMKHMVAMSVAVMLRLGREKPELARDVIFAAVADEEMGCEFGSQWLAENHPDLVRAEYAIGESGGFSLHIGTATFYPIQVAEKGICWIRARFRGEPGHGAMPRQDSATIQLAEAIARLGKAQLPVHSTTYVRDFLEVVAAKQPGAVRPLLKALTHPMLLPRVLKVLPDKSIARSLSALLSNTATPTVLRAGAKTNVIPHTAEVDIDGRVLPGQTDDDLLRELRAVMGADVELEVIKSASPNVTEPVASPLYDVIERQITRREPEATVLPYMIPGFTDAKYFTQLGARWYGFTPVKIDKGSGLRFADMVHGHDERVPVAGLKWGADLLYSVVREFCS
jgi:acetylornithine deacetylase/succinyl-diaminopimelate desuccinylase-like protein